ncbi:MAG: ATP-dependent RNA helicase dbp10 [Watsoniomyces obsoletus]|nr:MAG: ATP-dependent RNA helicase dbp10 [Watsoniomyces obsoletus]
MGHRGRSPAVSENEYDISTALDPWSNRKNEEGGSIGTEDDDEEDIPQSSKKSKNAHGPSGQDVMQDWMGVDNPKDLGIIQGEEDDDYGFIAAKQAASNRKASNLKGRSVKKGGGFQAMGLNATLLQAITRKGFSVPTPIQRRTVPLVLDGQDVVGMARTGSGKTAAFVLPMIEKLRVHSPTVGARALILSPSRELALQTLKVVKELGRGTDLRSVLLVGGDSLEDQFSFMASNPDIIIATPGRFLHLQVEMSLDLSSVRYVVFDEADRLFEMGFAVQLQEILHALPTSRQTLLFSATLPRSLVEFARAGLQEPHLIRLDAESKVSPDLESAFFTIKSVDKDGALLHLLADVIRIPLGAPTRATESGDATSGSKKRKRGVEKVSATESPTEHSTIVFASTKHHVEYLATLLRHAGFAVSHAYGSLDQVARRQQVQDFRSGITNILVVTDVAARGIDIPVLANVVNYDFPAQPKIFVHRVGRTARAGRRGRSYSLVTVADAPYLLDLQLFLGRKLVIGHQDGPSPDLARDIVVGGLPNDQLGRNCELVGKLSDEDAELVALRSVAMRGEKLYLRTRSSASVESSKRAKVITAAKEWMTLHSLFRDSTDTLEQERESMLARVSNFRPQETIFEIGKRANGSEAAEIMKRQREKLDKRKKSKMMDGGADAGNADETSGIHNQTSGEKGTQGSEVVPTNDRSPVNWDEESASEDEVEVTFSESNPGQAGRGDESWKDTEHFMGYTPASINPNEERAYGVHSGSSSAISKGTNFIEMARRATVELTNDEGATGLGAPSRGGLRWDKKSKKYVARANDEDGSKGAKTIRSESGQKIAASFRGGRFDAWRKNNKIGRVPRVGEKESTSQTPSTIPGRRFRHRQERAPKDADKFRDDYPQQKRRVKEAKEKRIGRFQEGSGRNELRSVDDVRKQRKLKERRRQKNARPSKRSSGR